MGNEETDVGMSYGTCGIYLPAFKIYSIMFKIYTKVKIPFLFEFFVRYHGTIINKSQNKITVFWDKSDFATLSPDEKLILGFKTQ
jgi:hypothetical protein